jgi:hypothetical protein
MASVTRMDRGADLTPSSCGLTVAAGPASSRGHESRSKSVSHRLVNGRATPVQQRSCDESLLRQQRNPSEEYPRIRLVNRWLADDVGRYRQAQDVLELV